MHLKAISKRLVYGGHTISLAYAQFVRAFPNIITLIGWQKCDHTAPVLEEDIINSEFQIIKKNSCRKGRTLYEVKGTGILNRKRRTEPLQIRTQSCWTGCL